MEYLQILTNVNELPVIRFQTQEKVNTEILATINYCFAIVGQRPDPTQVKFMASEMAKELIDNYKYLSIEESVYAFKKGSKGEYGEYFGLNVKSFCGFLRAYNESEERLKIKESKLNKNIKMLAPMKELTDEEKEEIVRKGCLEKFEIFKAKGFVNDMGNVAYEYLRSNGFINHSQELVIEFLREAEKQIQTECAVELTKVADIFLRNLLKDKFENTREFHMAEIKTMAKNNALNKWFSDMVEMDEKLTDLIGN